MASKKAKKNKKPSRQPKLAAVQYWRTAGYWAEMLQALGYALLTFIVALSISWVVLAKQNFVYPVWHDHAGIGQGIDKFGPQNRYKRGFGETSRAERIRLFAEINRSVHEGGEGLKSIRYQSPTSGGPQPLLRKSEVTHLQDVANLIDVLFMVAVSAGFLWLGLGGYLLFAVRRLPSIRKQCQSLSIALGLIVTIVLLIGPTAVFNQLHMWIFPAGHEWFFYYQDSLMSTLMLAPKLFGWIALVLLGLALVVFAFLQIFLFTLLRKLKP